MALSLNPLQLLEIIKKHFEKRDEDLQQFLDGAAKEGFAIAQVWDAATKKLAAGTLCSTDSEAFSDRLWAVCLDHDNIPMFWRLQHLYRTISAGLPGLSSRDQELVLLHVGKLLVRRDLTKLRLEDAVRAERQQVFLDSRNSTDALKYLRSSVEALYREAAALDAIARAYRLRP